MICIGRLVGGHTLAQPRSQGLLPGLGAGREKTLASAGHVSTLHPEILGVISLYCYRSPAVDIIYIIKCI